MHVRDATTGDAKAVRTVHAESITELGREGYYERQVRAWVEGCESADYTAAIEADGVSSSSRKTKATSWRSVPSSPNRPRSTRRR